MNTVIRQNVNKQTFFKRLKSMILVDSKRMFTTPLFYVMVGISILVPILVLVITSMLGDTTIDPTTGLETSIEGFTNVWQMIGTISGQSLMNMSITSMCNINIVFFLISALVCIFIYEEFSSSYSKNLFAIRSEKKEYIISKSIVCSIGGAIMILGYFVGAILGGKFAGLSFDLDTISIAQVAMSLISKIFLVVIFVSIYVLASVYGKQKIWLSILLSIGAGMLLFNIISLLAPLNATIINVIICFIGGILIGTGIGFVSNKILRKTDLV